MKLLEPWPSKWRPKLIETYPSPMNPTYASKYNYDMCPKESALYNGQATSLLLKTSSRPTPTHIARDHVRKAETH